MWSAANILKKSPKTSDLTNRDVSQLMEFFYKSDAMVTSAVFDARQHVASATVF